jgi:hypothetical protein
VRRLSPEILATNFFAKFSSYKINRKKPAQAGLVLFWPIQNLATGVQSAEAGLGGQGLKEAG